MPPDLPIPSTAWMESRRLWATELMHELAAGLRARGLRAYATVRTAGSTAGAILAFAAQERASLIALPTRRRGAAARLFLGSVADKLVRAAPMPVLVCRRAERGEPTRITATEASTLVVAGA
jgi:nucleotide-binding universal stress UspA family protein